MIKKLTTLLFSVFILMSFTYADSSNKNFALVQKQLAKNINISGDFTQIRKISGLDSNLKSSGTFSISKNSMLWNQTKPIKTTMSMSKNKLVQTIMDNSPTIITREKQPVVFTFTTIFMSIAQGNGTSINNYFDVEFNGVVNAWSLSLKPKSSPIDKAIKSISVKGGKYITSIDVVDTQGNNIDIKFSNIKENH